MFDAKEWILGHGLTYQERSRLDPFQDVLFLKWVGQHASSCLDLWDCEQHLYEMSEIWRCLSDASRERLVE